MKILHLDLELAPNLATVWGIFKVNIAINQLIETSRVLCYAAKWDGKRTMIFDSETKYGGNKGMIKRLHSLLDAADAVCTYNGNGFDLKIANREFLLAGLQPPSPYRSMDLLRTMRKQFRFVSNKLDHVCQELGLGGKTPHTGHQLWLDVMNGDKKAWRLMEKYNRQDVLLLESLYHKVMPWVVGHPNHGLYTKDSAYLCPNCGSSAWERRGYIHLSTRKYQRYHCKSCGKWSRGRTCVGHAVEMVGVT